MFKFLINLLKVMKPKKNKGYTITTEEDNIGTLVKIEADRELSPEEIANILKEQIIKGRKRRYEDE